MIALQVTQAACTAAEANAAIAALDEREGLYFGIDAGVPGIHPLQALVCSQAALRMRVFGDGLEVEALTGLGQALLEHADLQPWRGKLGRGRGAHALDLAREFLARFAASADVMLVGALRFDAWRLGTARVRAAAAGGGLEQIGTLWFPEHLLRRDGAGAWTSLLLHGIAGSSPAIPAPSPVVPASPPVIPASFPVIPAKAGTAGFHADGGMRKPEVPASAGMTGHVSPEDPGGDLTPADDLPPGAYAAMVQRAVGLLRTRPLASLTLSQSYRRRVPIAPRMAFARLRAANPAPACFFVNEGDGERLFGASPDLQLVVRGRGVSSIPVCGTVARKPGPEGEAESIRELLANEVDAAALAVCSRAMQEDLEPLCEPGSLRITDRQRPMALATVVHALDRVEGRLREGADPWDCIAATAAPVMLTGTPRAEALRGIAELEASPRGWYGGLMVQVSSNGDAAVGTILRAAAVRGDIAEVRTGGDLLANSDPAHEEQESRLKTRSLWRAFGLERTPVAPGARTTRIERVLPATPSMVYAALVDPAAIETWRVPQGMHAKVHAFDARVGGRFRVSLTYEGADGRGKTTSNTDTYQGEFLELVPDQRVVESTFFETADPGMAGDMRITYDLFAEGSGTRLVAMHENLPPALDAAQNEQGWAMALDRLTEMLGGR